MLQFLPTFTISDVINTMLFVLALVGLYLTIRQIRQGYQVQKATFFKDLYLFAVSDTSWRAGFYLVIHNKFIFDDSFRGSEIEKNIDALLSYFDMVGGLYIAGMLTKQEMSIFEGAFRQVYANPNIQAYLDDLRKVYKGLSSKIAPFANYVLYCQEELGIRQT